MSTNARPDLLTVAEAATLLRQSPISVRRRISSGELRALRVGSAGPLRIRTQDVERLLRPAKEPA